MDEFGFDEEEGGEKSHSFSQKVNSHDLNVQPKGNCDVYITDVLGLEERFWSPMFGLKGNADACVVLSDPQIRSPDNRIIGPLEIKTGKVSYDIAHVAQTTLYSLMMKDHYRKLFNNDESEMNFYLI